MALLEQQHELLEQLADLLGRLAVDGDLVAAHVDARVGERRLDQAQQLVALTEQRPHQVVAGNVDLHLGRRHAHLLRCCSCRQILPPTPYRERMPNPGDDLTADLARWLAEARVDEAAASRARETSLRQQAGEEATLAGVLLDLAERGTRRAHRGERRPAPPGDGRAVADDFCALRTDHGTDVLVAYCRHQPPCSRSMPRDLVAGDRPRALDMTLRRGAARRCSPTGPGCSWSAATAAVRTGELRVGGP